jgi:hypothetical protein
VTGRRRRRRRRRIAQVTMNKNCQRGEKANVAKVAVVEPA